MKSYLFYISLFFLIACKSKNLNKTALQSTEKQVFNLKNCKNNSQCKIEIIPNTTLIVKQDELQNTSIKLEKGEKTVIKYEFKRNELSNTTDSQHSELIFFEINNDSKTLFLTNKELQKVKMMYGRLCYCKRYFRLF